MAPAVSPVGAHLARASPTKTRHRPKGQAISCRCLSAPEAATARSSALPVRSAVRPGMPVLGNGRPGAGHRRLARAASMVRLRGGDGRPVPARSGVMRPHACPDDRVPRARVRGGALAGIHCRRGRVRRKARLDPLRASGWSARWSETPRTAAVRVRSRAHLWPRGPHLPAAAWRASGPAALFPRTGWGM